MGYGEKIRETIGANIVRGRYALGLEQQALAKLMGYTPSFQCQLEHGRKQIPDEQVSKIAMILGVRDKDLLDSREMTKSLMRRRAKVEPIEEAKVFLETLNDAGQKEALELLQAFFSSDTGDALRERIMNTLHAAHTMAETTRALEVFQSSLEDQQVVNG